MERERIGMGAWSLLVPAGWTAEEDDGGIVLERDDEDDESDLYLEGGLLPEPVTDDVLRHFARDWLADGHEEAWVRLGAFDALAFVTVDAEDGERSHIWYLRSGPVSLYACYRCDHDEDDEGVAEATRILDTLTRSVSPPIHHLQATLDENHERFVRRAVSQGIVWMLAHGDTLFTCVSHDGPQSVLLVWSDRAYAQRARDGADATDFEASPSASTRLCV